MGVDARAETLALDEHFWPRLMSGELGDFHHEFLITQARSIGRWSQAEMHPCGEEIVCLLDGAVDFVLQHSNGDETITLREPGAFVVVPRGVWHYAESSEACRLLFITAGENTQHRPAPQE
ncbi:hypothetical protein BGP77_15795 [Saccharospirillum sp. MSK14-1]|nr:hypothetical protein BGP77_15795 [Saccharospirillum sp. MSK14-1]